MKTLPFDFDDDVDRGRESTDELPAEQPESSSRVLVDVDAEPDAVMGAPSEVSAGRDIGGGRHRAHDWIETDSESGAAVVVHEEVKLGSSTIATTAAVDSSLAPYQAFDAQLPPVVDTPPAEMMANVVKIVETEGPILGYRLHQVYVKAAGGQRVGRESARLLNLAIETAERKGLILSDNPLNEAGIKPKTFRAAGQPAVSPRQLGLRSLDMVPPAELAHHLAELGAADDGVTEEELFRGVLGRLGLKRLTDNARSVLVSAMALVSNG